MGMLIYGSDPCPICGLLHRIEETPRARFLALKLAAELSTDEENWRIVTGGKSQRFMIGVLVWQGIVLVSRSGRNINALTTDPRKRGTKQSRDSPLKTLGRLGRRLLPMDATILWKYDVMAAPHIDPPYTTAGGLQLDLAELEALRPAGQHPEMGTCAAPHLVLKAREEGIPWGNWALSEVWYHPNKDRRLSETYLGTALYDQGISAYHCESCRVLVPALLCPSASVTALGLAARHTILAKNAASTATSQTRVRTDANVKNLLAQHREHIRRAGGK